LAEIESDKATLELDSPGWDVLLHLCAEPGDNVPSGPIWPLSATKEKIIPIHDADGEEAPAGRSKKKKEEEPEEEAEDEAKEKPAQKEAKADTVDESDKAERPFPTTIPMRRQSNPGGPARGRGALGLICVR
jgi:pyruvate/2-oxoglutarate dehydrogenase complex dihydrolipoamide acyltransferase (E2) component